MTQRALSCENALGAVLLLCYNLPQCDEIECINDAVGSEVCEPAFLGGERSLSEDMGAQLDEVGDACLSVGVDITDDSFGLRGAFGVASAKKFTH